MTNTTADFNLLTEPHWCEYCGEDTKYSGRRGDVEYRVCSACGEQFSRAALTGDEWLPDGGIEVAS